ncbi:MAG: mechanosensitive ion channel [Flavobacteriales bacterium]|nr:mechanosensitive ion channel [Flavobacteriales bacterium]
MSRAFVFKTLKQKSWFNEERGKQIFRIIRAILILLGAGAIIIVLDLDTTWEEIMNKDLFVGVPKEENTGIKITVRGVLTFIIILFLARLIVKFISGLVTNQLENNQRLDDGQRFTIVKLVRYAAYVIAFVFAANAAGVNLTALLVGSAALLVGVGLALQHIFDDIISGFIILFEGTFQVGDVIETEGMIARVLHIDIRTSKVITRDGNIIIVPNRFLTSEKLNNWSHGNALSRFHVTVGVSYSSDVEKVKKLLYQTALAHADVSKQKPIIIRFDDFGDSALIFRLFFWASRSWEVELLKSDLRFAIFKAFREHGVQIPFPQRDLHLIDGFMPSEGKQPSEADGEDQP